jgi:hypothetical protein
MGTITTRWQTLATTRYVAPLAIPSNPAAHGGACLLQIRRDRLGGDLIGRRVNTNGRHQEISEPFAMDSETLERWQAIAAAAAHSLSIH